MKVLRRIAITLCIVLGLMLGLGSWIIDALRPPPLPAPISDSFSLHHVTVINPGAERVEGISVAVQDGVFAESGRAGAPPGLPDYFGMYLLPGLADMHFHAPPDNALKMSQYFMLLALSHGVTTVRDAGDVDGTATPAVRALIAEGALAGPRMISCGPFVSHGPTRWSNYIDMQSPDDAAEIIATLKADGHTWVKAYENLSADMIAALVAEAEANGMGVMGHVPFALSYEEALLPDPQHLFGVVPPADLSADNVVARSSEWDTVDEARMEEIVQFTREHDLANTPTLVSSAQLLRYRDYNSVRNDPVVSLVPPLFLDVVWNPEGGLPLYRTLTVEKLDAVESALAKKKQLVKMLHDDGATLHLGTDTQQPFVVPGAALHMEMRHLADAGLSAEEVWQHATHSAYTTLNVERLGRVAPGWIADGLIFAEDPTQSLDALDSLQAVIVDGKLYTKADLDAAVAAYQEHYNSFPLRPLANFLAKRALASATNE